EEHLSRLSRHGHTGMFPWAGAQKPGGNAAFRVAGEKLISRDLFEDKAVVRLVAVEGADDVVTVTPGIWALEIVGVAAAIGIAKDVGPVTRPALAITVGGEEPRDQLRPGVGGRIVEKCVHIFGRGREAMEVKGGTANKCPAVGARPGRLEQLVDS